MKELTIKEKAEAYDEALERVNKLQKTCDSTTVIGWCEYIFPELRESDDEKIRKAILEFVRQSSEVLDKLNQSNMITWLEKQGKCETDCHRSHQDANHPNGCIVLEDFNASEGFYKVHLDYLSRKQVEVVEEMVRAWNNDSKTPDEDIKEPKKIEDEPENFKRQVISEMSDLVKDYIQQKSAAWSEEDEKIGKELTDFCVKCSQGQTVVNSQNDFTRWTVWLNSLKGKVFPQSQQDWSEEDEDAIAIAIIALEDMYDEDTPNTTYAGYNLPFNKAAERLKSLKDKYTWKPSEKQMNALDSTLQYSQVSHNSFEHLNSLYNELEKLK